MIEYSTGSIFECDAEALVNPVNCQGIAGKGLALEFKKRFPEDVGGYKLHCDLGLMRLGEVYVTQAARYTQKIFHFPTKDHWREPSCLQDIKYGIRSLIHAVEMFDIQSIAIPALGCGLGGLDWNDVRPLIERAAENIPNVRVIVFPPKG